MFIFLECPLHWELSEIKTIVLNPKRKFYYFTFGKVKVLCCFQCNRFLKCNVCHCFFILFCMLLHETVTKSDRKIKPVTTKNIISRLLQTPPYTTFFIISFTRRVNAHFKRQFLQKEILSVNSFEVIFSI